jgi:hypothetical protein
MAVAGRPKPVATRPHGVAGRSHGVATRPMPVASRPKSVAVRPTVSANVFDHSTCKIFAAGFAPPRLSPFAINAPAETVQADDGAFVQAAQNDFVRIAGFDLKGNLAAFDGDDARGAMNRLPDGRRREVADVYLDAHGTLVRVQMRREDVPRGAFKKLDEVRRGDDGRHAVAVKFHGVLQVRGNGQLADFTDSGARFHFSNFNAKTRRRKGAKNF